jgi:hypothetical protein
LRVSVIFQGAERKHANVLLFDVERMGGPAKFEEQVKLECLDLTVPEMVGLLWRALREERSQQADSFVLTGVTGPGQQCLNFARK